jgi:hypothetical protein
MPVCFVPTPVCVGFLRNCRRLQQVGLPTFHTVFMKYGRYLVECWSSLWLSQSVYSDIVPSIFRFKDTLSGMSGCAAFAGSPAYCCLDFPLRQKRSKSSDDKTYYYSNLLLYKHTHTSIICIWNYHTYFYPHFRMSRLI